MEKDPEQHLVILKTKTFVNGGLTSDTDHSQLKFNATYLICVLISVFHFTLKTTEDHTSPTGELLNYLKFGTVW